MSECAKCKSKISIDEIGLNLKLISRELDEYLCIDCLSEKFNLSREILERKIEYYKSIGCELFK